MSELLRVSGTFGQVQSSFRRNTFSSRRKGSQTAEDKAESVVRWAKEHAVNHFTFLVYPHTRKISHKIETLMSLNLRREGSHMVQDAVHQGLGSLVRRGEGDGSSFPTGGLRQTHTSRTYMAWDEKSQVFIHPLQKVLCIPALLISHEGIALDDKTIFRKSEERLSESGVKLLKLLKIEAKQMVLTLGIEQQFFAVPMDAYLKREDLRWTQRTLFGNLPAKHQQLSDHYYGKMPQTVLKALRETEEHLLRMGFPFQTKHNEVSPNQFQFCHIYEEAGKAIDHNMIAMEVLKEVFAKHNLTVLLHQKPFQGINGSGKHCNWALNYIDEESQLHNLFSVPKTMLGERNPLQLSAQELAFKVFLLINLAAVNNHARLYASSIATPGNQYRLGGHEAPPRIMSVSLGSSIAAIIDRGDPSSFQQNLQDTVFCLKEPFFRDTNDRNRTSPYAYTGNKFEFRAVGASQNTAFPLAVIAATLHAQIDKVITKLESGINVYDLIEQMVIQTRPIRYEGNGYDEKWVIQAESRGLYVNRSFSQLVGAFEEHAKVLVQLGICLPQQLKGRAAAAQEQYINVVQIERETLIRVVRKQILHKCMEQTVLFSGKEHIIGKYGKSFDQDVKTMIEATEKIASKSCETLKEAEEMRKLIDEAGKTVTKVLQTLRRSPDLPDLDQMLFL